MKTSGDSLPFLVQARTEHVLLTQYIFYVIVLFLELQHGEMVWIGRMRSNSDWD